MGPKSSSVFLSGDDLLQVLGAFLVQAACSKKGGLARMRRWVCRLLPTRLLSSRGIRWVVLHSVQHHVHAADA